jgi:hypothetical protein
VVERVELAQVISQLRQELSAAMRESEGKDLRFELGPVELELTVGVSRDPRRRGVAGKPLISGSEQADER